MLGKKKEKEEIEKAEQEGKAAKKRKRKKEQEVAVYENGAVNYNVYVMSVGEKVFYILLAAAGLWVLGYIFYRSLPLSCVLALLSLKFPKYQTQVLMKKRKQKLNQQFKDMLYSLSSAVSAGNSVERGFALALDDMMNQYADPNAYIVKELELIVSKLSLGQNIEEILLDFGQRSGLEDIVTFANIFEISKRTGGNLVRIIRQTTDTIADKIEIESEIDTMLSGKKMEQKVLVAMPIFLVFVLTQTTEGFMTPIFTTLGGRMIATFSLLLIAISYFWSKKITDIQV
ncbi:MAG: type II secretion system F family protein [bacterium]|nr:type II secretion system F family protein [bacterium]